MKINYLIPKAVPIEINSRMLPREDQIQAFKDLSQWGTASDYSQVGTGKSLVSYLRMIAALTEGSGVLVVMPPPLIPQYISKLYQFVPGFPYRVAVFDENRAKRHKVMDGWDIRGWPDVLVISYAMFLKYFPGLSRIRKYRSIICDEAHILSNFTNKTFERMFSFVWSREASLLLMTATPAITEINAAYGHIRLKDPKAYSSYAQFERMHIDYEKIRLNEKVTTKVIVGYRDVATAREHLMKQAIRRLSKDVLDLQEPTVISQEVPLSAKHLQIYRKLLLERMLEYGEHLLVARNQSALRQMALQIITNLPEYTQEVIEETPIQTLLVLVDSIDLKSTKLVIFCHFKKTVRRLAWLLAQYNPALVYGDSDSVSNVARFKEDQTCRILIANYQSGGSGFDLQDVCHYGIMYEAIGSPGVMEQAIGRLHRGGQTEPVVFWVFRYLKTKSTELINKGLTRADQIREVVGDDDCVCDFITHAGRLMIPGELP